MDDWTLRLMLDQLKYLNRLNKHEFGNLLFPNAVPEYLQEKWTLFSNNMLAFLWSCDQERLVRLVDYIKGEEAGGYEDGGI
tara:strand:- start:30291 stop:30533 length:243 start_codon:yes stop_codon:yes gene_type:complete